MIAFVDLIFFQMYTCENIKLNAINDYLNTVDFKKLVEN